MPTQCALLRQKLLRRRPGTGRQPPGSARFFPTKLFHRSDLAPRRCVKVVFFLNLGDAIEVKSDDSGDEAGKEQVKTEAGTSIAALSFDAFSGSTQETAQADASETKVKTENDGDEESPEPKRGRRAR